jgi:4'-phosphopantetheinyl transferase
MPKPVEYEVPMLVETSSFFGRSPRPEISMDFDSFGRTPSEELPDATRNLLHVWQVNLTDICDADLLQRYADILSSEEHARRQRLVFAKDRHRDLVTRALVRTTLSRFAQVDPRDWLFGNNGYGRPTLDPSHSSLCFNIAHSGNWVVMAVGHDIEIGVDIEYCRRPAPLEFADFYFAKSEASDLGQLSANERPLRFFELWTLKESYIKARGLGLSIPLNSFAFDLRKPGSIALDCQAECDRNPEDWRFLLSRSDACHLLALCFRAPATRHVDVVWRNAIPLQRETALEPTILRRTPTKR